MFGPFSLYAMLSVFRTLEYQCKQPAEAAARIDEAANRPPSSSLAKDGAI